MIFGSLEKEQFQLNEDSVWYGGYRDRNNPDALKNLPKIRELILKGEITKAEKLMVASLSGVPQSMRLYQPLAELFLNFDNHKHEVKDYHRHLDLSTAIHTVSYKLNGYLYTRETFSSNEDNVMIIHLTTTKPDGITFTTLLKRGKFYDNITSLSNENGVYMSGNLGADGMELAGDEYIDPSDGLIHCKKCGGQRQTVVPCFGKSGYFMPRCICQCQREAEEQRKAAEERQRRMERIKRRKAQGLQDRYLYDYTFANDNGKNPLMDKARAYVENWKEAYKNNTGLLLFGDVGTGKSFFAGCIANALLDRDVPVLMTNFPTILNRLTGMFSEDRSEFIASFDEYDLLIIDDLGVERSTEYAMEQMFFVIDSRYRSRRPMIITTNLKLSELKNPPDLAHARIYDRILERCAPILFDGKNFREENAGATRQTAKDIVNSKQD